jgi:enoyl-CoA hydratase/carnithine racemase
MIQIKPKESRPMSEAHLLYRVEENVAWFTINREPQRNAISPEAVNLFLKYLDEAETDEDVRVILITGAGDRAFCSGADLAGRPGGESQEGFRQYARLLKRLSGYPKPVVARINGYCLAGGMGFMLACDIVISRNDAKFGTPEVNVGLWPMMIGALIFRNILRKKAMEMVLIGERFGAEQALEMGLITRAVPSEKLDEEVQRVVETLAAKSPIGMKIGKEAFYAMADMPFESAVDFLSTKIAEIASTKDAREGITAFLEKRQPVFKGR